MKAKKQNRKKPLKKKIKKKNVKKIKRQKRKSLVTDEIIQDFMKKGRDRGFITLAEILKKVPRVEKDIEGLEKLYQALEEANIKIIEKTEFLDIPEKEKKSILE